MVQQRIFNASPERPFLFELTGAAKGFLLSEGTDPKYGARHLKRAIERLLVQPICSLIATRQVRGGDCIRVDWERAYDHFTFTRQPAEHPCPPVTESPSRSTPVLVHEANRDILFELAEVRARSSQAELTEMRKQ